MKHLVFSLGNNHWQQAALVDYSVRLLEEGHSVHLVNLSYLDLASWSLPITTVTNFLYFKNKSSRLASYLKNYELFTFENRLIGNFFGRRPLNAEANDDVKKMLKEEIVTILRDSKPCNKHTRNLKQLLYRKYQASRLPFSEIIDTNNPDIVVIFNGRFLLERTAWLIAAEKEKRVQFIERFTSQWSDRYFVFDYPVHSIKHRSNTMLEYPSTLEDGPALLKSLGKNWFLERQLALTQDFTASQNVNFKRPLEARVVVSFFHSSEDELFATDLASAEWETQFDVIETLINVCNSRAGYVLVVRLHPNLLNKSVREQFKWRSIARKFESDSVIFLMSNDPTNSYSLIRESDYVVTAGSTIGVEAAFMKKPSVLCGLAFHQEMNILEIAPNRNALERILSKVYSEQELMHKSQSALSYGFFLAHAGTKISYLTLRDNPNIQDPWFQYSEIVLKPFRLSSLFRRFEANLYAKFQIARRCNCEA